MRAGNEPNTRLTSLISSVGDNVTEFRERFNSHKDLPAEFATGDMHYASFAARVRRRELGAPEDSDEVQDDPYSEETPDDIDWD